MIVLKLLNLLSFSICTPKRLDEVQLVLETTRLIKHHIKQKSSSIVALYVNNRQNPTSSQSLSVFLVLSILL